MSEEKNTRRSPLGIQANIRGKNFYMETRHRIEFFGIRGLLRASKIYIGTADSWNVKDLEVLKIGYNAKDELVDLVNMDIAANKEHLISDILISPKFALIYYFHSMLWYRMHMAKEVDDEIQIPIELNKKIYKLIISPLAEHDMATRDINGKIIE